MRLLSALARACALLAGALLMGIALLTCASIVGREALGYSMAGDFELSGAAAGLAVALLMPMCYLRGGNIIVDAFTIRVSRATNASLDRFGAIAVALLMALLAWRTAVGATSAWASHATSMLMGFPDWVVYAGMVPPLVLTACIALRHSMTDRTPEVDV